jgi:hypothetical protein
MATFKLSKGQRYRATLMLGWLEQMAGNERIAAEFSKAGFEDVVVEGSGDSRVAEGVWRGESMMVALPEQVAEVVELA